MFFSKFLVFVLCSHFKPVLLYLDELVLTDSPGTEFTLQCVVPFLQ